MRQTVNKVINCAPAPSMWWVGLLTISLVWYVGNIALPPGLNWIDDRLILNISAALFLILSLLLNITKPGVGRLLNLLGQAICAAAFIAVDLSSSGPILNIVLVAQLPFILGIRKAILAAIAVNVVHFSLRLMFHDVTVLGALLNTGLFACFQLFALLIGHYAVQASEARNELAASNAELLATRSLLESTARDRERLRVSRELHDTAGHTLTALKLNLRQLRDRSEPEQKAALTDCLVLSSDLLEDIRALVGNLREHDPLDLRLALEALTHPFSEPKFRVIVDDDIAINDLAMAEDVLAVARESITNVVRHAHASHCTIRVEQLDGKIQLTVEDDGIGPNGPEGFGIKGMRERIQGLGGVLEVLPRDSQGTRVNAVWAQA